ncbi:hypothetical protein ABEB36_015455 [Hypothenemus hampei]|uniref:Uncharacterized protein n=1 Tax=Hypothenemus hampei TaxID=57062 RepID=A0ABD1E2B5_HYPHA
MSLHFLFDFKTEVFKNLVDMDLQKINEICLAEEAFSPIVKLQDLTINEKYLIYKAKLTKTNYGSSILLNLKDKVVFLPQRVTDLFVPNLGYFVEGKYALIYKGTKDVKKPLPMLLFEISLNPA